MSAFLTAGLCFFICHPELAEGPAFDNPNRTWMRLQAAYVLKNAEHNKKFMARASRIIPMKSADELRT